MTKDSSIGGSVDSANHSQDITGKAAMLLDSSTAHDSVRGTTAEPHYDEGMRTVLCPEVREWYYLLLQSGDIRRYNDILTGRRTVEAMPRDVDVREWLFQFRTFVYTSGNHRQRIEKYAYNEKEYSKRMAIADDAERDADEYVTNSEEQLSPCGGGFLFVNAPIELLNKALDHIEPRRYPARDCATHKAARIDDNQMRDFIRIYESTPWNMEMMNRPIADYARNHQRIRITGGFLKGTEGYIIRLHRDRNLVFSFGNMTLAIKGIHSFPFEPVV